MKIEIPDSNEYDEKAAAFVASKQGKRLNRKYTPKPYQDRFKWLFMVCLVVSVLCNAYNALSASTFAFSYLYGLVGYVQYSFWPVVAVTAVLLILVEVVQRILPAMIIKDWFQFGFSNNMIGFICIIGILSTASVAMSYFGSFDLSDTITEKPVYIEPELKNLDKIRSTHLTEISEAKSEAREFKNANSYKGKLDYNRGRQYSKKLDHIAELRKAMQTALNEAKEDNTNTLAESKAAFNVAVVERVDNVEYYGSGMAKGSIVSILLLFLCIWYCEFYDFRTASQYADPANDKAVFSAPENNQITVQGFSSQAAHTTKHKALTNSTQKNTVTHNGKPITKSTAQSRYATYIKRAAEAKADGKIGLYEKRNATAIYWNGKLKEFK